MLWRNNIACLDLYAFMLLMSIICAYERDWEILSRECKTKAVQWLESKMGLLGQVKGLVLKMGAGYLWQNLKSE